MSEDALESQTVKITVPEKVRIPPINRSLEHHHAWYNAVYGLFPGPGHDSSRFGLEHHVLRRGLGIGVFHLNIEVTITILTSYNTMITKI